MASDQLTGTLLSVNPATGAPTAIIGTASTYAITTGLPYTNTWNSGHCMVSTTVDGVQYMFIRFDSGTAGTTNAAYVYRGTWNDTTKKFENFTQFANIGTTIAGTTYNNMARLSDTTMRIISDAEYIVEFDVRTGAISKAATAVGGTWSPSSYTFANTFVPKSQPTIIIGASGDGTNWYQQVGTSAAASLVPTATNTYADGFGSISASVWCIHPSTHFPVSYYVPNNGTIQAYAITGVFIQEQPPTANTANPVGIFTVSLSATAPVNAARNIFVEYGTTTSFGTSVDCGTPIAGAAISADLYALAANTTYYYRFYWLDGSTKIVSTTNSFSTKTGLANVSSGAITSITATTASAAGTITSFDE
jgi:hypothetical protein